MGAMSILQHLRLAFASGDARPLDPPAAIDAPAGAPTLRLRPLVLDDADAWNDVRMANEAWLAPWESGNPEGGQAPSYAQWIARQRRAEQRGTGVTFGVFRCGDLIGQVSLGGVSYGAMRTGVVGYWIDRVHAGHGYAPLSVAMLADWALGDPEGPRLHRLEIAILPENERSLAVARKLGARHEGLRPHYMYVRGAWRDHETFSLLAEDRGEGFTRRLLDAAARG